MKILTDDHWEVIMEQIDWLKSRVKELEQQNAGLVDRNLVAAEIEAYKLRIRELEQQTAGLLDRLLIEKGQMPLNGELRDDIKDQEKAHHDLFEQLTVEEIGEEPKDEVDSN